MLENTINTLVQSGFFKIHILSKSNICFFDKLYESFLQTVKKNDKNKIYKYNKNAELKVIVDNSELNTAIINYLRYSGDEKTMIVMSDLPLINKKIVIKLLNECSNNFVIVPSYGGGTNILYISETINFNVKYHGNSFLKHINEAKRNNMKINIFDSYYLSLDFDKFEDIIDVLIHSKGKIKRYLKELFFIDDDKNIIRKK